MDNTTRFNTYIKALSQFALREGHCNVPAIHTEIVDNSDVTLGAWVGYVRQRRRKNQLSEERATAIQAVSGWQWGPLKPGPATDDDRNTEILQMRAAGSSLRQIADKFDLSRQRVHQIVKNIQV
jgi:DNA-binding NarL/FixJ family response regulator